MGERASRIACRTICLVGDAAAAARGTPTLGRRDSRAASTSAGLSSSLCRILRYRAYAVSRATSEALANGFTR
ncbi:Uncharacterised protein [Mycobacteroides abscessus subsp. massiliense]|nr:Uncharacterised protein [Mycobacteroides abscessus subsp. massiliense]